jgi:acyl carrier protein
MWQVSHARPALDVAYLGPQNDLERAVAGIWQQTLGLEQVGVNDNFFELGGNSLLGAEIIAQVKQTLGFDVPIVRLFEQPTVRTFAASLAGGPADPQAVAASRSARGERRRGLLQQQRERYREHA